MNYYEFMNRPVRLRKKIEHKADEVAFKLEICLKATTALGGERVQTSKDNTTERSLTDYIDAKNKMEKLVDDYDKAVEEVATFLYENLDFRDADLLEWKYINGKTLAEIADIIGVSYQTAKHKSSIAERRARAEFDTKKN